MNAGCEAEVHEEVLATPPSDRRKDAPVELEATAVSSKYSGWYSKFATDQLLRRASKLACALTGTAPVVIFLHYFGVGPTDTLALRVRAAIDNVGKARVRRRPRRQRWSHGPSGNVRRRGQRVPRRATTWLVPV